jgi:phosphate starvation-inducible protein PhoH
MSTVLVIQPYKMLQRAFVVALPFEYEVRVMETLPDSTALKDINAVIVDAAALTEKDLLPASGVRTVQSWNVPTVWIDSDRGRAAPTRDKLICLRTPVQKDALQKAVAECLTVTAGATAMGAASVAKPTAKETKKRKARKAVALTAPEPRIIELVEVVEEMPAQGEISTQEN